MASVRPYKESDKERVQHICLANAECLDKPESLQKYILIMYCNYYIEQEPGNCFVAVNDEDEAVGYIICSENYDTYEERFKDLYLNQCAAISPTKYVEAKLDLLSHSMFKKQYPTHFHIDIDDNYQRMGLGSLLISTLKAHLRKKNINSMMMVCGEDNQKAIDFYKKNGFKDLITTKMGHAMGLEFED
ncbi:MAG: GNAT family N-acetyltransferase [Clostridia bacterium]|nr:GNAT family N-acetyltransferase [Clostridia bacterium]